MTNVTDHRKELFPRGEGKLVILKSLATPTGALDTVTMNLALFGIRNVLAVQGFVQTTVDSVIVKESGTTSVTAGVLTYLTAAGNNNKVRVVHVYGES